MTAVNVFTVLLLLLDNFAGGTLLRLQRHGDHLVRRTFGEPKGGPSKSTSPLKKRYPLLSLSQVSTGCSGFADEPPSRTINVDSGQTVGNVPRSSRPLPGSDICEEFLDAACGLPSAVPISVEETARRPLPPFSTPAPPRAPRPPAQARRGRGRSGRPPPRCPPAPHPS